MPGFPNKTDTIWMNGTLTPWADAQVHVTAHALHYGTGVFEGMRSYDTPDGAAIFRLEAHIQRFIESAKAYEIPIAYSVDALCDASLELIRANKLENAYMRPIAFFDVGAGFGIWPRECPVTVAIIAVPGRQYVQGGPDHAARLTISTVRRIDASTLPPAVKACGHYTNSVRAIQEAIRRGYDDALLLNSKGDVAEAAGANLFMVSKGTVITNDGDASILFGITRDSVLQIARDLGLPVAIRPMTLNDVQTADELFLSGTAVEVTAIRELDGRKLGDGTPGPITRRLQEVFLDAVHGKVERYKHWLAYTESLQRA
jgi:branched-chain amino acid aminotransferase